MEFLTKENLFTDKSLEHIHYIDNKCNAYCCKEPTAQIIGHTLSELGFVELFQDAYQMQCSRSQTSEITKNSTLNKMVGACIVLQKLSLRSKEICDRIMGLNLHTDFVKYLCIVCQQPPYLNKRSWSNIIISFLRIIRNVIRQVDDAQQTLSQCNGIKVLQDLCQSEHSLVFCFANITNYNLVKADETDINYRRVCDILAECAEATLVDKSIFGTKFHMFEITIEMTILPAHDVSIKAQIFNAKLQKTDRPEDEQEEADRRLRNAGYRFIGKS